MLNRLKKGFSKLAEFSDNHLVRQAQQGNAEAFGSLYKKYLNGIFRYIFFRTNQNHQLAEDLCELVFLKAWKNIENYKPNGVSCQAWLYRIAHNVVVDEYRKVATVTLKEDLVNEADNPEAAVILGEKTKLVQNALKKLTAEQRQVITLRFIENMKYPEIAGIMKKKEDAVRALQHRGLKELKKILQNYA